MKTIPNYPGNKHNPALYPHLINLVPPITLWAEATCGSAGLYCNMAPASHTVLNDIDPVIFDFWDNQGLPNCTVLNTDAAIILTVYGQSETAFIYLDPPYPITSRRSQKALYNYEMSDQDHERLLYHGKKATSYCMFSSYSNPMYDHELRNWNKLQFPVMTHGGKALETVYFNYEPPTELHDYQYLGKNFTDRQRLKRKVFRNIDRLKRLPEIERNLLLQAIYKEFFTTGSHSQN